MPFVSTSLCVIIYHRLDSSGCGFVDDEVKRHDGAYISVHFQLRSSISLRVRFKFRNKKLNLITKISPGSLNSYIYLYFLCEGAAS